MRNDYLNSVDASDGSRRRCATFDQTESLHTTPGYDDVTGVGSPNGQRFLAALAAAAAALATTADTGPRLPGAALAASVRWRATRAPTALAERACGGRGATAPGASPWWRAGSSLPTFPAVRDTI